MPTKHLVRNEVAATGLHLLTFDAPPVGYETPGQFVTAGIGDGKPAFFALASSPGHPMQLLVKRSGEMAEVLCDASPGDAVSVSDVMGGGFPLAPTSGRPLLVLVNGSGISAARPVLHSEVAAGLPRPVHLFYGVLSPAHRAFTADLERWANAGIQVHTIVDPAGAPGWDGPTGYVQAVAQEMGLITGACAVVLVGLKIMVDQAKGLCADAGVPEDCVVTNF